MNIIVELGYNLLKLIILILLIKNYNFNNYYLNILFNI